MKKRAWFFSSLIVLGGCGSGETGPGATTDSGSDTSAVPGDGGRVTDGGSDGDGAEDAAKDVLLSEPTDSPMRTPDASMPTDSGMPRDSMPADATPSDVGPTDSTSADADVSTDSMPTDSGVPTDSVLPDAAAPTDSTPPDAGAPTDSTPPDAGTPRDSNTDGDAGIPDAPMNPRRIPLPCDAPLPTGFCLRSDPGDYIGGGMSYTAGGSASVTISGTEQVPNLRLANTDGGTQSWTAQFAAKEGEDMVPGLYDPAQRYPFHAPIAGLSVTGNGRGCNTVTGRFAVEELGTAPQGGISRFSVTFEQHCEGGTPALRGVINYQATGNPDPPVVSTRAITLIGKIFRVAYDATNNIAYGLDATNRQIATINISTGSVSYTPVPQLPSDACVDLARGRLFVVNNGGGTVSEYRLADLTTVREITWGSTDAGASATHFHVYCAPSKLYVVDSAWAPGLYTVENLDTPTPTVTNHTSQVSGVGGLVLNAAFSDLYYWYQYGWGAGTTNTYVRRLATSNLTQLDETTTTTSQGFVRDPLDVPVLLDETRNLVFSKNCIFDALNLTRRVFTLPGPVNVSTGALENTYALDAARGRIATRRFAYELAGYAAVSRTLTQRADQMFFDRDGLLWYLTTSKNLLEAQAIP